jgi:adenylylsulfate kinase-like enzyme
VIQKGYTPAKARAGEITNLTGIGDVYEIPLDPDLSIDTSAQTTEAAVDAIAIMLDFGGLHRAPRVPESEKR